MTLVINPLPYFSIRLYSSKINYTRQRATGYFNSLMLLKEPLAIDTSCTRFISNLYQAPSFIGNQPLLYKVGFCDLAWRFTLNIHLIVHVLHVFFSNLTS